MFLLMAQMVMATTLGLALLTVMQLINQKSLENRSKNSPFECGFDPQESARLPFSLRFFLLAIIFLIFDIEIALLFPLVFSMKMNFYQNSLITGTVFLIILMTGLIHEWNQGTLAWVKSVENKKNLKFLSSLLCNSTKRGKTLSL